MIGIANGAFSFGIMPSTRTLSASMRGAKIAEVFEILIKNRGLALNQEKLIPLALSDPLVVLIYSTRR